MSPRMAQEILTLVAQEWQVSVGNVRPFGPGNLRFDPGGLPVLPFFTDLAAQLGIELDAITIEHMQGYEACPTCGPDACTFEVTLDLSGSRL